MLNTREKLTNPEVGDILGAIGKHIEDTDSYFSLKRNIQPKFKNLCFKVSFFNIELLKMNSDNQLSLIVSTLERVFRIF